MRGRVNAFTDNVQWEPNLESVKQLAPNWIVSVKNFIQNLKDTNAPQYLIIMNENALAQQKSAGATFCGIRFNGNKWSGHVLGDSCLIEIVKNKIQNLYTSQNGDEFDNHPDYFDSNPLKNGKGKPFEIKGVLSKSTSIIIVSDPFSDFLNEKRKLGNEEEYIKQLLSIENHDEFEELVAEWRDSFNMHNDDSTLVIIEYDGHSSFDIVNHDEIDVFIAEELELSQQQNSTSDTSKKCEEIQLEEQSSKNESVIPKTMSDEVEQASCFISGVPIDDFIQTGIDQYERIIAKNASVFLTPPKDDVGILKDTLVELYNTYYQYFNK